MAGMTHIEEVAHHVESILRFLKNTGIKPVSDIPVLFESATHVENFLVAFKEKKETKPSSRLLKKLEKRINILQNQKKTEGEDKRLTPKLIPTDYLSDNENIAILEYRPNKELYKQGVTVDNVRDKIISTGRILKGGIKPESNGNELIFEFIIATECNPEDFKELIEYGVQLTEFVSMSTSKENSSEPMEDSLPESPRKTASTASNYVRVELEKLDDIIEMVGNMVINRSKLEDSLKDLFSQLDTENYRRLVEINQSFEKQIRNLREGIMRVRLVPVSEIFERMHFVVRELVRESGKKIELKISGQNTLLDKYMIERIFDPLLHIVRNAVSHGIENEKDRRLAGKPEVGTIVLKAFTIGDLIYIDIEDDGAGLNINVIKDKAIKEGLMHGEEEIDSDRLLQLISSSGFTTRVAVDKGSGRGVGMSVVKDTIYELGGNINLKTEPGKGTTFSVQLPLTLSIIEAFLLKVNSQEFCIPLKSVIEVVQINHTELLRIENNLLLKYRNQVIPAISLAKEFNISQNQPSKLTALVTGSGSNLSAFLVDKVIALREVVVRQLTDPLINNRAFSGATITGDGHVVLILDTIHITRQYRDLKMVQTNNLIV